MHSQANLFSTIKVSSARLCSASPDQTHSRRQELFVTLLILNNGCAYCKADENFTVETLSCPLQLSHQKPVFALHVPCFYLALLDVDEIETKPHLLC